MKLADLGGQSLGEKQHSKIKWTGMLGPSSLPWQPSHHLRWVGQDDDSFNGQLVEHKNHLKFTKWIFFAVKEGWPPEQLPISTNKDEWIKGIHSQCIVWSQLFYNLDNLNQEFSNI